MSRCTLIGLMVLLVVAPVARAAEQEVEFVGATELTLRGTLVLPDAPAGRVPVVLLVAGSGPTDRNGNQPGMKIDLLSSLADALRAVGVGSFRYDKRAHASYAPHWPKHPKAIADYFAMQHFVGDAAGAIRMLKRDERIDASRIFVLGHSEGGLIALQLAALPGIDPADRPAGLVLAATPGRRMTVLIREQLKFQLPRQIPDQATVERLIAAADHALDELEASRPIPTDIPPLLRPLFNPSVARIMEAYATIDPATLAPKVSGPVLVLQGESDMQVSAERDAPRLAEALRARAAGATESIVVPNVSHNFKTLGEHLSTAFVGPVDPRVVEALQDWARKHVVGSE